MSVAADARPVPRVAPRVAPLRIATLLRAALWVLLAGNLVRLPALTSGAREAPLSVNDLAVLLTLSAGALACVGGRALVFDRPARRAIAFALVGALSAVLAVPRFGLTAAELGFSLAYLVRWLVYFALYVLAVNTLRRADVPAVVRTLERVILVFAAFGIVQSAFLPGFAQLVYPEAELYIDWDPQGHRLVSTFLDPNFAGIFIVIGLLLAIARQSCGAAVGRLHLAVLAVAVVLTASRSSILAAIVGGAVVVGVAGLTRRMVRIGVALGVLLLAALPALLEFARSYGKLSVDASAVSRVVSWLRALELLRDNPILGVGFNTYGFVQRAYGYEGGRGAFAFSLDGGLLFIAVMTGGVGLLIYLTVLHGIAARARGVWRATWATPEERAVAVAAVASIPAVVVHSLFVNSLLQPFILEALWILWALPAVVALDGAWRRAPVWSPAAPATADPAT
jgi:O-antigen ligase